METEYWAHHYIENPATDEVEDDDFDLEAELAKMADEDDDWEEING